MSKTDFILPILPRPGALPIVAEYQPSMARYPRWDRMRAMARTGRPSKRTPAVERAILDGLASGRFLRDVCADEGMPNEDTVYGWMESDPEFSGAYARARARGAAPLVADGMKILDDCDDSDAARVSKARERAHYRRWLAGCYDRATFGERKGVELSGPDGGAVKVETLVDLVRLASKPVDTKGGA